MFSLTKFSMLHALIGYSHSEYPLQFTSEQQARNLYPKICNLYILSLCALSSSRQVPRRSDRFLVVWAKFLVQIHRHFLFETTCNHLPALGTCRNHPELNKRTRNHKKYEIYQNWLIKKFKTKLIKNNLTRINSFHFQLVSMNEFIPSYRQLIFFLS